MNIRFGLLAVMLLIGCATAEKKPEGPGSGMVKLKFDVNKDGKPENIRVLEEKPANIFAQAAIKRIQEQTFTKSEKGEAPPFKDEERIIDFVEVK